MRSQVMEFYHLLKELPDYETRSVYGSNDSTGAGFVVTVSDGQTHQRIIS